MSQLTPIPRFNPIAAPSRRGFLKSITATALALPSLFRQATAADPVVTTGSPAYFRAIPQAVTVGTFSAHPKSKTIGTGSSTLLPPIDFDQLRNAVVTGNINHDFERNNLGMAARVQIAGWSGQEEYAAALESRLQQLNPAARLARGEDGNPIFFAFLATRTGAFDVQNSRLMNLGSTVVVGDLRPIFVFDQRPLLKLLSDGSASAVCMATLGTYHPTASYIHSPTSVWAPKTYNDLDFSRLSAGMDFTDGQMLAGGTSLGGLKFPATVVMGAEDPRLAGIFAGTPVAPRIGAGSFAYIAPPVDSILPIGLKVQAGSLFSGFPEYTPVAGLAQVASPSIAGIAWTTGQALRGSVDPLPWQGLGLGRILGVQRLDAVGAEEVLTISALVVDSTSTSSAPAQKPSITISRTADGLKLKVFHTSAQPCAIGVHSSFEEMQSGGTPTAMIPLSYLKGAGDISEVERRPEFPAEFYAVVMDTEAARKRRQSEAKP